MPPNNTGRLPHRLRRAVPGRGQRRLERRRTRSARPAGRGPRAGPPAAAAAANPRENRRRPAARPGEHGPPRPARTVGGGTPGRSARSDVSVAPHGIRPRHQPPGPRRRLDGASTTRRCAQFVLRRLIVDKATVSAVARELGRSWDTVNSIAVEATTRLLLQAGPARLVGVQLIGVDEHKWSHTRSSESDGLVTVITDLTAVVDGTGPARLLDLVPGRSAAAMRSWLDARDQAFRDEIAIVAMDGSAATRMPPHRRLDDPPERRDLAAVFRVRRAAPEATPARR